MYKTLERFPYSSDHTHTLFLVECYPRVTNRFILVHIPIRPSHSTNDFKFKDLGLVVSIKSQIVSFKSQV